jgi:hypothetical protein
MSSSCFLERNDIVNSISPLAPTCFTACSNITNVRWYIFGCHRPHWRISCSCTSADTYYLVRSLVLNKIQASVGTYLGVTKQACTTCVWNFIYLHPCVGIPPVYLNCSRVRAVLPPQNIPFALLPSLYSNCWVYLVFYLSSLLPSSHLHSSYLSFFHFFSQLIRDPRRLKNLILPTHDSAFLWLPKQQSWPNPQPRTFPLPLIHLVHFTSHLL